MKQFTFKFQTILDFRSREEQVLQKELALLQQTLEETFQILYSLQNDRDSTTQSLQQTQQQSASAGRLKDFLQYIDMLKGKIVLQQDEIIKLQNQVAKKRQKLLQAKKNKEILEKLKEKHYADWKITYEKSQAALLDEMATMRYQHQQLGLSANE